MPLDGQTEAYLAQAAANPQADPTADGIEAYREAAHGLAGLGPEPATLAEVRDIAAPGPAGDIPLRVYTPHGEGAPGILVYLHGGGFVRGDLETHDRLCRALASGGHCVVVAVHYRRPPEALFPAALEDSDAATIWVSEHAAELGADAARLAVAGDSAGGALATVVARRARDRGGPAIVHQGLFYPAVDATHSSASLDHFAEGYLLTRASLEWSFDQYVPAHVDRARPELSPLLAEDLSGLPPALVITAEFDPVRDEGEAYAERMRAAGVEVQVTRYVGTIHNFMLLAGVIDQGGAAIDEAAGALRRVLAEPWSG